MNDFGQEIRDALKRWDLAQLDGPLGKSVRSVRLLRVTSIRGLEWETRPLGQSATVSGDVTIGSYEATCDVTFERTSLGQLNYETQCDCGVDYCAHAAVLLLAAQERARAGRQNVSPFEVWAENFSYLSERPEATASDAPEADAVLRAGLVISTDLPKAVYDQVDEGQVYVPDRVPLQLVLLEPPTGRNRRPKLIRIDSDQIRRIHPDHIDTFARLRLGTKPEAAIAGWGPNELYIKTAAAEKAFIQVLESGGAYFSKFVGDPARRADDVAPSIAWQEIADGQQALRITLPSGLHPRMILKLHSVWYVTADGSMGRLQGPTDRLMAVTHAPTIRSDEVAGLSAKWKKLFPGTSIPAPTKPTPLQEVKEKPAGVVRIALRSVQGRSIPTAALSFAYGEHEVKSSEFSNGIAHLAKGNKRFAIHERPFDELNLTEDLARAGFLNAGKHSDLRELFRLGDDVYVTEPTNGELDDIDAFLRSVDLCEAAGFAVLFGDDVPFGAEASPATYSHLSEPVGATPGADWFALDVGIELDGKRHSLVEVASATLSDPRFQLKPTENEIPDARWTVRLPNGDRLRIPLVTLRKLLAPIVEWLDVEEAVKKDQIRVPRLQAALLANAVEMEAPSSLVDLRAGLLRLGNLSDEPLPVEPAGFNGVLRPYQREGLRWLNALAAAGLGGILADDMGLGKTAQLIVHITYLKERGELNLPVLIVVTKSLVGNWLHELATFSPGLSAIALVGNDRRSLIAQIPQYDIAITTYNLLPRDIELLLAYRYTLVAIDEAQNVKNPTAQAGVAINSLGRERTLALTGTPLENHPEELWSQFNRTLPGYFGTRASFNRTFGNPIAKRNNAEAAARLSRRAAPFILRRTKEQVATDLPPKTETTIRLALDGEQRALYEAIRIAQLAEIQAAVAERGLNRSGAIVLTALLKLRQACCDPRLTKLPSAMQIEQSVKLDALSDLVREAVSEGRRILVFSEFAEMIKLISQRMQEEGFEHLILTGQTENRDVLIKRFQDGAIPLFLLTRKAGGVGVNLPAADTVIHYDPWWNPAAENQATDRAHRIGQVNHVMVYRLITEQTIEERIEALQEKKAAMADDVLSGAMSGDVPTTLAGVEELLALI